MILNDRWNENIVLNKYKAELALKTIQKVVTLMEEKNISRQLAENYVYSSGLTIYSTVDNAIQARLEEEYAKEKNVSSSFSSANIKKLKSGKTYKVRVRAYVKVGSKKYYGSFSKVYRVKTK
mgnify:CR=1 FL=1